MQFPPYPWQQNNWKSLSAEVLQQRLPHAILLHGPEGLGKSGFASHFAQTVLCSDVADGVACGRCKSCLLFHSQSHPDFLVLAPEDPSKAIKIDQVRGIADFIGQSSQQGGHRCIVINPADMLNINASNALLKSLEEPPESTTFLLVAASLQKLGPTVRSRCRFMEFKVPAMEQSLTWLSTQGLAPEVAKPILNQLGGSPLTALAAANGEWLEQQGQYSRDLCELSENSVSVVNIAKQWSSADGIALADTLMRWISRGIANDGSESLEDPIVVLISKLKPMSAHLFYDKLINVKALLGSSSNPNKTLLWEDLLLDWIKCVRS